MLLEPFIVPAIVLTSFISCVFAYLSLGPVWDKLTREYVGSLSGRMTQIGMNTKRIDIGMRLWGFTIGIVVFVFLILLRNIPLAVGFTYVTFVSPRFLLEFFIERRQRILRDQMVMATQALANSSRAGLSLAQGLRDLSDECPSPLGDEIKRIVGNYNRGRAIQDEINATKTRLNIDSFTLFASSILVSLDRGGRETDSLERISKTLLESQRLERKMDSDTATGKLVMLILAFCPFGFLGFFYFVDPESSMLLLNTVYGQIILGIVFLLVYGALRLGFHIMKTDY